MPFQYSTSPFRLLFRIVPVIVPHRSIGATIGATIGANLRFIGAIGANFEFIGDIFYDIIYDKNRFAMTLVELSMTSNIDYLRTNNQSNFFNSSTSGRASRNFSGISSLRRYVATPIGLA